MSGNILENIPDGGERKFRVVLTYLCCDSPKVNARIPHLLFKYLISERSVSAPTSFFSRRESDGFSREDEEYRGTSQTVYSSGIRQDVFSGVCLFVFLFCCHFLFMSARCKHHDSSFTTISLVFPQTEYSQVSLFDLSDLSAADNHIF